MFFYHLHSKSQNEKTAHHSLSSVFLCYADFKQVNMQCISVFRTQSNINHEIFLQNIQELKDIFAESSIIDVQLGSKYPSPVGSKDCLQCFYTTQEEALVLQKSSMETCEGCISNVTSYILGKNTSQKFQDSSCISELYLLSTNICFIETFYPTYIKIANFLIFVPKVFYSFQHCQKLLQIVAPDT